MTKSTKTTPLDRKPISVSCPHCNTTFEWSERYPDRPFCSKRCKDADFIGWANEEHRIAGNTQYDDVFSDEPDNDSIH